jgi:ubiquinone/menaquinone biosynthesis C-methylase UbiE
MPCVFLFSLISRLVLKRNYDTVALFYDRLARLIFGSAQVNAQLYLLRAIPPGSRVLIAGGGTGWILEEIAGLHPVGLTITYVDASEKMISLSKKRRCGANQVSFITASVEDAQLAEDYDVVITPFLFDNLEQGTSEKICSVFYQRLKPKGVWLYCDFERNGPLWQRLLLLTMYAFFRLCCGIKAKGMPDMSVCFDNGYKLLEQKKFYRGFIVANVFEKEGI